MSRPDSILSAAGRGSVLGPVDAGDDAAAALASICRSMRQDWKAAAWYLQRSPSTRDAWSDLARQMAEQDRTMRKVLDAIKACGMHPNDERRLLLQFQAHGLGLPSDEGE